ncbi:hypothetical protein DQ166_14410, partial [Enterococcus faecalis]|nr:hypothetical protein [Enterococcus faecalis]
NFFCLKIRQKFLLSYLYEEEELLGVALREVVKRKKRKRCMSYYRAKLKKLNCFLIRIKIYNNFGNKKTTNI